MLAANQLGDRADKFVNPLVGLAHPPVGFGELNGHLVKSTAHFRGQIRHNMLESSLAIFLSELAFSQDVHDLFQSVEPLFRS